FCSNEGIVKDVWTGQMQAGLIFHDDDFDNVNQDYIRNDSKSYLINFDGKRPICAFPSLTIDVVSLSRRETVKLAPYLVVKVTEIEPIVKTERYNFIPMPRGAGGLYDIASSILLPDQDALLVAPIELHKSEKI